MRKERTLREIIALALSAGWKVVKVTRAQGSLFGHILAVLVDIPVQEEDDGQSHNKFVPAGECAGSAFAFAPAATVVVAVANLDDGTGIHEEPRIDTPTFAFASNVDLRSVAAALFPPPPPYQRLRVRRRPSLPDLITDPAGAGEACGKLLRLC
jgi:hypothetical protein